MSTTQELIDELRELADLGHEVSGAAEHFRKIADRLASLSAENARLKAKLAGVDEKGGERG